MKGIPVLRSKLKLPQPPHVLAGPRRLQDLCVEIGRQQLVVVQAPAGYGKSTLMVTALSQFRQQGDRICWYCLGEEDRDPTVFYTHLVESLFPERGGPWDELRAHLESCGDIARQHRYINALICQELWGLQEMQPTGRTILAFDDFQHLRDLPDLYEDFLFLIDHLPENWLVMVSSRHETGLLTAQRRLTRRVLHVTPQMLCFSTEEASALLQKIGLRQPEENVLQKIMEHTEGWPAGIVLFCQLLDGSAGDATSLLDWPGSQELFFQYMAAEVIKGAEDRLLSFLVKAAIFSEFSAAEAAAVFDEEQAAELLEDAYRKGLFLQKIPGTGKNKESIYRCHALFRKALLQVQPLYLAAEEVKAYHLKAAIHNMEQQVFDRAIEHFVACGNLDLAVELVTRESARLVAFEAVEPLRLWFKLLPEEVVSASGQLLFIKSFASRRGVDDSLQLLGQALALFQQKNDPAMQFFTLVAISNLKVQRSDVRAQKKIHAQLAELARVLPGQPFQEMLAVFAFITAIWEEKLSRGASLLRIIQEMSLPDEWHWLKLFYTSQLQYLRGELEAAERTIREALELELVQKSELLRGCTLLAYSLVLQAADKQGPQPRVIQEMTAIGERNGYLFLTGSGKRQEAFAAYRRHDLDQALELLEASTDCFTALKNTALAASNRLYRALWLCREQQPALLLPAAEKALKALLAAPCGQGLQEVGLCLFGVVAREAGAYDLAEANLNRALRRSRRKGLRQITGGICLHLARLCFDRGQTDRGEALLRETFELATREKYPIFLDIHFPTLVEMAARSARGGMHVEYATELLARYYGSEAGEYFRKWALSTSPGQIEEWAGAFLSRYGVPREIQGIKIRVNLLGRFTISVNGTAIPERAWKTKKISGIFKYLLVQRNQDVPKERLMEEFWPVADRKHASLSLRAAQHELKKVLRTYGVSLHEEPRFLVEKRDSLAVRSGNLLEVDVDQFLACEEELRLLPEGEAAGEQKKNILQKMVALYQGDLLEEEIYEDWAFAEREGLKSIYFSAALELARVYCQEGAEREAEKLLLRVLALDPFNEEACLSLLKLYTAANQKGRAARLYDKFIRRYEEELHIKPDARLIAELQKLE